ISDSHPSNKLLNTSFPEEASASPTAREVGTTTELGCIIESVCVSSYSKLCNNVPLTRDAICEENFKLETALQLSLLLPFNSLATSKILLLSSCLAATSIMPSE